jgi:phosphopentomutase
MGNFLVIVLDGFGVGQMPDVPEVRPTDIGANTCVHIFETNPDLKLPNLASLGLANVVRREFPGLPSSDIATYGRSKLMHDGADTFFGHQEIMGTKPPKPKTEAIQSHIDEIASKLRYAGFKVRIYTDKKLGLRLLIVNEAVTVADNVECDPGQAWNVTAAIDDVDFDTELEIGRIVRGVAKIPRVIVFGGRQVHLPSLLSAIEIHGDLIGVNAPKSGVYVHDYHCIHMGYGVDEKVQVPYILGSHGIDVHLLGKVADVCANKFGESESIVDTAEVLNRTLEVLKSSKNTFICTNVQETDLCGHRQNSAAYADRLRVADECIGRIRQALTPDDYMIVMADHGNDPTIGHPHHTREYVPLLISYAGAKPGTIGTRDTESDVGATVADFFDVEAPQNGTSFLSLIKG